MINIKVKKIISSLTSIVMIMTMLIYFPNVCQRVNAASQVDTILNYGRSLIGSKAYDGYCQAFVKDCYASAGIYSSSNASSAYEAYTWWCVSRDASNIPIGAVLYFNTSEYGHAAIYTGNNTMLHGVATVREETISSYYWNRFLGWGFQAGIQPSGADYKVDDMNVPTFTLDKSEYHVGDTVTVRWTESSATSNLSHYWLSVYRPGEEDIQRRIDPPASTTSFVVDRVGEYTINMQATPRGSVSGEGSLSSIQSFYVTDPVTMVSPEFHLDKSVYYVGDTVNIVWQESSPESNLDHYWLSVYCPNSDNDIQSRIDPPASTTNFIASEEGEYTITMWATPKGSEYGEGSLTVQQTIYVRKLSTDLSVVAGDKHEPTKFHWIETRDNKCYNLRIFNGELWETNEVDSVWGITDTECFCNLPSGHYKAYIDTVFSDDSFIMSNVVEFDVGDSTPEVPKLFITGNMFSNEEKVNIIWDKTKNTDSYWLHIYKDGKDYENKSLDQELSYSAIYPVGEYTAYIVACNSAGETLSKVEFVVYENGDCNNDGKFNISDVVLLQKWLLSVPDTHLANWQAADLCEDGKLDVFDLVMMKRLLINS